LIWIAGHSESGFFVRRGHDLGWGELIAFDDDNDLSVFITGWNWTAEQWRGSSTAASDAIGQLMQIEDGVKIDVSFITRQDPRIDMVNVQGLVHGAICRVNPPGPACVRVSFRRPADDEGLGQPIFGNVRRDRSSIARQGGGYDCEALGHISLLFS
jgi:hypothetical protein